MRIFVTGATGFVGTAVVQDLIGAGHKVLGLARSEAGAAALKASGADAHHGSLEDLESLRSGAAAVDGVAHLAFNHDFSKFAANGTEDARAIEVLGSVLEGSKRPLLVTSGLAMLAQGRPATEADFPKADPSFPRKSEAAAAAVAARGVNATSVRLPPSTHGAGDHGFVPILINIAREKGVSAYVGEGQNLWSATHRFDAAKVYRLALERGAVDGPYHAVAEESIPFRQIAEAIGRGLNIPVVSKSGEEAAEHFGWFAMFAGADVAATASHTRDLLQWKPEQPGLIADMQAHYFG